MTTPDRSRVEDLFRRLEADDFAPIVRSCGEMPEDYKLRPDALVMMRCFVALKDGHHEGDHCNRLGEKWPQKPRERWIDKVPEGRYG